MVVPSETQIVEAVTAKLGSDSVADADLARLLATLELENDWTDVSAKKFRSVLVKHSIMPDAAGSSTATSNGASSSSGGGKKKKKAKDQSIPKSYIDASVAVPPGIRTHYFDAVKGKGLLATRAFARDDIIFTEDAYIPTPPPHALDQITRGELCAHCFLPISSAPVALAVKDCQRCKQRFCTTACFRAGMATHHALLCVGHNPGARGLMELVVREKWQSLHSVARALTRVLSTLAYGALKRVGEAEELEQAYGDFETVYSRISSFATVSELERRARNPGWSTEKPSFDALLAQAHAALRTALDPYSPTPPPAISTPLDTQKPLIKHLFDPATLPKLLGRANINMEKFGGLYSLHSFLNHSCHPNVQIRHMPERGILASMKVAAIALRPIAQNDELVISYIDPTTSLGRRQLLLYRDYCFGPCTCDKCSHELNALGLVYDPAKHGVKGFLDSVAKKTGTDDGVHGANGAAQPAGADASLEEELRASLGF
ncbi:conserved hypothetical protein [Sporisorium reilianum SRZ2]|uniref:Histone-lysine N-methyltransferase SET5 n=1 Tax=Sporisorium reilianum (strain SRZ2) TaxID=999809 RepID=E6ZVF5_SPORE|nr:conserved hypothetical protein [Sporisorium reilianum SRZ2]